MRVFRFLLEMSQPFRIYLWLTFLAMVIVGVDRSVKPYLIKTIIDAVTNSDFGSIWIIVLLYTVLQGAMIWAWSMHDWCSSNYFPQITRYITQQLLDKMNRYPYTFFQEHLSGSIASKIRDAAKLSPQIINTVITELIQIILMLTLSIILLSRVHYGLGIAMVLWVILFCLIGYAKLRQAGALSAQEAEADSSVWGNVVDFLTNIFSVKLFASFPYEQKRLDGYLDTYVFASRTNRLYLRSYFVTQGIIFSFYILFCLCGMIYLSKRNVVTPGDFALVFMLNFDIVSWLFYLTTVIKDLITNLGTVTQSLTLLEGAPTIQDDPHAQALKVTNGSISFDHVRFNYKGTEVLFQDKSVTIESEQKVGLVGYSGGGKTTFVHLILRLYEVTGGSISIDGQDIRDVTQESLRKNIAMIPQDPSLFHRSLKDNIHYGRLDASDQEIVEAAQRAHADEFITHLPQKYDSLVGERGVKLSGGQRQRIALARAFLKNAPILILDEATSQLDSVTERLIQESLWELMRGKTTIVIAHRLSTILHMDRILVFEQGAITEDGSHETLLAQGGLYKTLWDSQVEGFLPEG